eukprot:Blabericola_migrator_1__6908@NODE_34_length_18107_cov_55_154712_g30_i0_p1_GENE_NODE_34_length_18107_cov_55_154712_g30_i0NODE_34_length_18107_cov_55_154712_g30_i0_p1_ORF_typecomplete_len4590_score980_41AAA_5/PF07728_14/2_4e09AAA_5/PF07728_14/1_1e06AAA_5/PF07728_14/7_8e15AAA_5/PF07728_14/1_6e33AAA_5/PF07728_14/2e11AAA_5/PF07728_14/9_7e22AAA_5/PF07728_14/9_3e34AAA_5/PF07728_14/1_9e16AAA_3/PF07726_11/0_015AAA_3/PF07726_11/1_4AAA_3/PF07726_11/3_3e17AAA_3/PF07726_11/0_00028AAA_3/PF07726_11/0_0056AAA_3
MNSESLRIEEALSVLVKQANGILLSSASNAFSFVNALERICPTEIVSVAFDDQTDSKDLIGQWISVDGDFSLTPGFLTKALQQGLWLVVEGVESCSEDVLCRLDSVRRLSKLDWDGKEVSAHPDFKLFLVHYENELNEDHPDWSLEAMSQVSHSLMNRNVYRHLSDWPRLRFPGFSKDVWHSRILHGVPPKTQGFFKWVCNELFPAYWDACVELKKGLVVPAAAVRRLPSWLDVEGLKPWLLGKQSLVQAMEIWSSSSMDNVPERYRVEILTVVSAKWLSVQPACTKLHLVTCLAACFGLKHLLTNSNELRTMLHPVLPSLSSTSRELRTTMADTHVQTSVLSIAAQCLMSDTNILLVGSAGSGKTAICSTLSRVNGVDLFVFNFHDQSEVSDLIGDIRSVGKCDPVSDLASLTHRVIEYCFDIDTLFRAGKHTETLKVFERDALAKLRKSSRIAEILRNKLKELIQASMKWAKKNKAILHRGSQLLDQLMSRPAAPIFESTFIPGPLLQAMKKGGWILLDEINLAPPDLLARLYPLLKKQSDTFVVHENGGEIIQVHPSFRIMGTMNPPVALSTSGQVLASRRTGKKDLPKHIRDCFAEIYVDELTASEDLERIVSHQCFALERSKGAVAQFYLEIRALAESGCLRESNGTGALINLRHLTRALGYVKERKETDTARLNDGSFLALFVQGFKLFAGSGLESEESKALILSAATKHLGVTKDQLLSPDPPQVPQSEFRKVLQSWLHYVEPEIKIEGEFVCIEGLKLRAGQYAEQRTNELFLCTPSVRRLVRDLVKLLAGSKSPILLEGPTSAGKTSLVEFLACASRHKFVRINNHDQITMAEYTGQFVANDSGGFAFAEGPLLEAVRHGHWVVLDEFNLAPSEVVEGLNRLLDDNRAIYVPELDETVQAHPHFLLFATQNPVTYGGRKPLSEALKSRFVEFNVSEPPAADLKLILMARSGVPPEVADSMVTVYKETKIRRGAAFDVLITIRDLLRWGKCMMEEHQVDTHLDISVVALRSAFFTIGERLRSEEARDTFRKFLCDKFNGIASTIYAPISELLPEVKGSESIGSALSMTSSMTRLINVLTWCWRHDEPCLLVGATGTGKTTAVQYVSEVMGKKLIYLSCQQSTDVSDFIGAFKPRQQGQALIENLTKVCAHLETRVEFRRQVKRIKEVIEDISKNKQPQATSFSAIPKIKQHFIDIKEEAFEETQRKKVKTAEVDMITLLQETETLLQSSNKLFEWRDGPLLRAMKQGCPFLLDEINLADDAVIERLNSVLESSRSFFVPELNSEGGCIKAAQGFRFFATMNPGGDYGKRELSKALRNRLFEVYVPPIKFDDEDCQAIIHKRLHSQLSVDESQHVKSVLTLGSQIEHVLTSMMCWLEANCIETVSLRELVLWIDCFWQLFPKLASRPLEVKPEADALLANVGRALAHSFCASFLDGFNVRYRLHGGSTLSDDEISFCKSCLGEDEDWSSGKNRVMVRLLTLIALEFTDLPNLAALLVGEFWSAGVGQDAIEALQRGCAMEPFLLPMKEEAEASRNAHVTLNFAAPSTCLNALRVIRGVTCNAPVLLEGPPGAGKTSLLVKLASLTGRYLYRLNLSEQTELADLVGTWVPKGGSNFVWESGPLAEALDRGSWILLDEINLAPQPVLEGLNSLLDHRREVFVPETQQTLRPAPGFQLFAAQNRFAHGGGRKGLPRSFLNRFLTIDVDALSMCDFAAILPSLSDQMHPPSVWRLLQALQRLAILPYGHAAANEWEWNVRDLEKVLAFEKALRPSVTEEPDRVRCALQIVFGSRLGQLRDRLLFLNALEESDPAAMVLGMAPSFMTAIWQDLKVQMHVGATEALPVLALALCIRLNWVVLLSCSPYGVEAARQKILSLADKKRKRVVVCSVTPNTDGLELMGSYSRQPGAGFEWIDSPLVKAIQDGSWVIIDGGDSAQPGVLDRLNSLLETRGTLTISEAGEYRIISRHPDFRIFVLSKSEKSPGISHALRNRCVEICLDSATEIYSYHAAPTPTIPSALMITPPESALDLLIDIVPSLPPAFKDLLKSIYSPGVLVACHRLIQNPDALTDKLCLFHSTLAWLCSGLLLSSLSHVITGVEDPEEPYILSSIQRSNVRQYLLLNVIPSVINISDFVRLLEGRTAINKETLPVILSDVYLRRLPEIEKLLPATLLMKLALRVFDFAEDVFTTQSTYPWHVWALPMTMDSMLSELESEIKAASADAIEYSLRAQCFSALYEIPISLDIAFEAKPLPLDLKLRLFHSSRFHKPPHICFGTVLAHVASLSVPPWSQLAASLNSDALDNALLAECLRDGKASVSRLLKVARLQTKLLDLIYFELTYPDSPEYITSLLEIKDAQFKSWLYVANDTLVPLLHEYLEVLENPDERHQIMMCLAQLNVSYLWKISLEFGGESHPPESAHGANTELFLGQLVGRVWFKRHYRRTRMDAFLCDTPPASMYQVATSGSLQEGLERFITRNVFVGSQESLRKLIDMLAWTEHDCTSQPEAFKRLVASIKTEQPTRITPRISEDDEELVEGWLTVLRLADGVVTAHFKHYLMGVYCRLSNLSNAQQVQDELNAVCDMIGVEVSRLKVNIELVYGPDTMQQLVEAGLNPPDMNCMQPVLWALIQLAKILTQLRWMLSHGDSIDHWKHAVFTPYLGVVLPALESVEVRQGYRALMLEASPIVRRSLTLQHTLIKTSLVPRLNDQDTLENVAWRQKVVAAVLAFHKHAQLPPAQSNVEDCVQHVIESAEGIWNSLPRAIFDLLEPSKRLYTDFLQALRGMKALSPDASFAKIMAACLIPAAWSSLLEIGHLLGESLVLQQERSLSKYKATRDKICEALRVLWATMSLQCPAPQPVTSVVGSSTPLSDELRQVLDLYDRPLLETDRLFELVHNGFNTLCRSIIDRTEALIRGKQIRSWSLMLESSADSSQFAAEYDGLLAPLAGAYTLADLAQRLPQVNIDANAMIRVRDLVPLRATLSDLRSSLDIATMSSAMLNYLAEWRTSYHAWVTQPSDAVLALGWRPMALWDLICDHATLVRRRLEEAIEEEDTGWKLELPEVEDWGNALDEEEATRLQPLVDELFGPPAEMVSRTESHTQAHVQASGDAERLLISVLARLSTSQTHECKACLRETIIKGLTLAMGFKRDACVEPKLDNLLVWQSAEMTGALGNDHTCTDAKLLLSGGQQKRERAVAFHDIVPRGVGEEVAVELSLIEKRLKAMQEEFTADAVQVDKYLDMTRSLLKLPLLHTRLSTLLQRLEEALPELEFWNSRYPRSQDKIDDQLLVLRRVVTNLRQVEVADWSNLLIRRQLRWSQDFFQTRGLQLLLLLLQPASETELFHTLERAMRTCRVAEFPLLCQLLRVLCEMLEATGEQPLLCAIKLWLEWSTRYRKALETAFKKVTQSMLRSVHNLQALTKFNAKDLNKDKRNLRMRRLQLAKEVEKLDAFCRSSVLYVFAEVRSEGCVDETCGCLGDTDEEISDDELLSKVLELVSDLTIESGNDSHARTFTELRQTIKQCLQTDSLGVWREASVCETELLTKMTHLHPVCPEALYVFDDMLRLLSVQPSDMNEDFLRRVKYDLHLAAMSLGDLFVNILTSNAATSEVLKRLRLCFHSAAESQDLVELGRSSVLSALASIDECLLLTEAEQVLLGPATSTFLSANTHFNSQEFQRLNSIATQLRLVRHTLCEYIVSESEGRVLMSRETYRSVVVESNSRLTALINHSDSHLSNTSMAVKRYLKDAFLEVDEDVESIQPVISPRTAKRLSILASRIQVNTNRHKSDLQATVTDAQEIASSCLSLATEVLQNSISTLVHQPELMDPAIIESIDLSVKRLDEMSAFYVKWIKRFVNIIIGLSKNGFNVKQEEGEAAPGEERYRDQWNSGQGLADGSGLTGAQETVEHEHELDTLPQERETEEVEKEGEAEGGQKNEVDTQEDFGGNAEKMDDTIEDQNLSEADDFDEKVDKGEETVEKEAFDDRLDRDGDIDKTDTDSVKGGDQEIPEEGEEGEETEEELDIDMTGGESGDNEIRESEEVGDLKPDTEGLDDDNQSGETNGDDIAQEGELEEDMEDGSEEAAHDEEGQIGDMEETPDEPDAPRGDDTDPTQATQEDEEEDSNTPHDTQDKTQGVSPDDKADETQAAGSGGPVDGAALNMSDEAEGQSKEHGPEGGVSDGGTTGAVHEAQLETQPAATKSAMSNRDPTDLSPKESQQMIRELLSSLNKKQEAPEASLDTAVLDDTAADIGTAFGDVDGSSEQKPELGAEQMAEEILEEATVEDNELPDQAKHAEAQQASERQDAQESTHAPYSPNTPSLDWPEMMRQASQVSGQLSESLRMVLEPTKRGRYEGYFKSGKRLGMRQVMAYVASEYKRDKIWLRRTKLSKRQYEVILAVDNSASMRKNNAHVQALTSTLAIALALKQLEAGEVSVMTYGGKETTDVSARDLLAPSEAQTKLDQVFSFTQAARNGFEIVLPNLLTSVSERFESQSSDSNKLLIILTDGKFSKNAITPKLARLEACGVVPVLVMLSNTVYTTTQITRDPDSGAIVQTKFLSEDFPFRFYIVAERVSELQYVLADVVRSYMQKVEHQI